MRFHLLSLLTLPILALASLDDQFIMPGSGSADEAFAPELHSQGPTLADLLTIETSNSIFYTYARETELSQMFVDQRARNTVLVPTNKAVMALARKPHQGPETVEPEDGTIISEEEFDTQSKENVRRWVSAHIIPQSPISVLSPEPYGTLLEGKSVAFTQHSQDSRKPEWERVRLNNSVKILGMKEACNGVIYIIDGTVLVD